MTERYSSVGYPKPVGDENRLPRLPGELTEEAQSAAEALAAQKANGLAVNAQAGTTYTLAAANAYEMGTALNTFTNASAITVTVPKNSVVAIPVGHRFECVAGGTGKVTFAPVDGDVTITPATTRSISAQDKACTLIKVSTNSWRIVGSLIA